MSNILNSVLVGDCVGHMRLMPSECIDLTVTSPPYDNLRTYNGYSFDFENVAKELYRITKAGGVVVWVVGDSTVKGSETGTSFKQALFFKEIGFNLHDTMIYVKENWVPLTHNRYEQQFEYIFILSKGKPKIFNPLKVPCIHEGVDKGTGRTFRQDKNGKLEGSHGGKYVKKDKIKGNVWTYQVGFMKTTTDKIAFYHPATFPEKLAEDHILSWSNVGDIVFDPMCGSGTTLKMAKKNGRAFIGIDVSEEYANISRKRVEL